MLSGKPGKFLYLDDKFYYLGEAPLSGKFSYLEVMLGPNLQRVLRPGKLCLEDGQCGWLVIRRRRNQYYVYLQSEGKRDIYLGALASFQQVPTTLLIRYTGDGKLAADINRIPNTPQELIGVVKSLALIANSLPSVEKLLNQVLTKYKLDKAIG